MENKTQKNKSFLFPLLFLIFITLAGWYGWRTYQYAQNHEETDNAQIASNITPVVSRISGYIQKLAVQDNQRVKKGDTLLILDNRDQKIALQQALAGLEVARTHIQTAKSTTLATSQNLGTNNAAIATAEAQIEAAKVNIWKANQDLKRYENLVKDHIITRQQYEAAIAAKQAADKQLNILIQQRNQIAQQAQVVISQTDVNTDQVSTANAMLKQRQAEVENAQLNLSYTIITAPEDGFTGKIPVQPGQFITAGTQLFPLVRDTQKWIIANFKETQVSKIVENQQVKIKIDAFPDREFEGLVSSFSPATGSSFSVLPPDNASGNFVKVVQRVPVRIDFQNLDQATAKKLRAGMNVKVEVELR